LAEIRLELEGRELRRFRTLASVSRTMAAKSLTFTAEKAVPAWRAGHHVFTKRRPWIDSGVRMRPATAGNLNARVGTIDLYMGRHVVGIGDEKRASGRGLFVPNEPARQQGTHTQIRRRISRMRSTQRKPFWIDYAGGRLLVRRKGKARTPLTVLGRSRSSVDIPERLDALGIVSGVVHREFGPVYERLLLRWAETGRV